MKKKYPDTTQSIGILVIGIGGNTFSIQYWYWLLQYFCILVLVLVIAIQFNSIVNNPGIFLVQKASPTFGGDTPIFGRTALIFGGVAPNFGATALKLRGRDRERA